jgi:Glycosyltransferase family 87
LGPSSGNPHSRNINTVTSFGRAPQKTWRKKSRLPILIAGVELRNYLAPAKKNSWVIFALLVLSATEWTIRGPVRAFQNSPEYNDFLSPYVQAKVWLAGQNPYHLAVLTRAWPYQYTSLDRNLIARGIPSPYPITGFPLLAPFATLSWTQANLLWQLTEILAFGVFVTSLFSVTRRSDERASGYLLLVVAFAFAPFHTAIAVENVALVALALATSAITCERKNHAFAGVLLAFGLALKPTVAAPAFAYLLIRRRWPSLFASVAICFVLFLAAAGRMTLAGTQWLPNYLENGKNLFAPGTTYDFSSANPLRFDLINAQVIFSQLMSRSLAQYFAMATSAMALLAWLHLRKRAQADQSLLDLSLLSVVILVPLYHRFYDGALLIFPIAWAIGNTRGALAQFARIVLAAVLPFVIPGAAMLRSFERSSPLMSALSRSWWWNLFVAAHQAWLVLVVLMGLLLAMRKLREPNAQVSVVEGAPVAA